MDKGKEKERGRKKRRERERWKKGEREMDGERGERVSRRRKREDKKGLELLIFLESLKSFFFFNPHSNFLLAEP
jgi:hypothetical protein